MNKDCKGDKNDIDCFSKISQTLPKKEEYSNKKRNVARMTTRTSSLPIYPALVLVRAGASVYVVFACVCVTAICSSQNPLAPKVYGAANGKRKNPKRKMKIGLKKSAQQESMPKVLRISLIALPRPLPIWEDNL